MANKINNLLKFEEYDHLQPKQKPTNKTEIGGFAVLEGISVKELVKLAAQKSGKSKKELKNLSPKKLKKLIGENKFKTGKPKEKAEKKEEKDSYVDSDHIGESDEDVKEGISIKGGKVKKSKKKCGCGKTKDPFMTGNEYFKHREDKEKNESILLERKKASAKQLAARKRFMDMIKSKKGKEESNESLLTEKKKASAKQLAARKRFMDMINSKKKGKKVEDED